MYPREMLKDMDGFRLPEIEEKVLRFWDERNIFHKSIEQRKGKTPFVFFEGPPTANGRPGTHHVLARVFKDIIPRFKTMQGFYVTRRAGWDTQGLPVEIEVEKELGLKNKQQIEEYGVAQFNKKAKESVWKYKDEWERLTKRIGFWVDFDQAYITYDNAYLETVWWIFKQINDRGYLKKQYKVLPYCPRCQTALSSHELAQPGAYKETEDPSVFVMMNIIREGKKSDEYVLVWTTTPWTLPANVGVAVNASLLYSKFKITDAHRVYYVWSAIVPPHVEGQKFEKITETHGNDLVGLEYVPLYDNKGPHRVYAVDFVSENEGTGVVHLAPFGENDLDFMKDKMRQEDFPVTVDDSGRIKDGLPGSGKFIKQADKDIISDLIDRGLMYYHSILRHEYPYCWRCSHYLIYFPRLSWFIEMSRLRHELAEANQTIHWIPDHIRDGRFGHWLSEVKDWAISRDRYWGTPLPIWECSSCDRYTVIGGLDDLSDQAVSRNTYWVIRHGESLHNVDELIHCRLDSDTSQLTDVGREQVTRVAEHLKNSGINLIYCSPFKRARQTCEIINTKLGVEVIIDDRLKEINCGSFHNTSIHAYRDFFKKEPNHFDCVPEDGESLRDVKKRASDFMEDIHEKNEGRNILIISHGDPLRMIQMVADGMLEKEVLASPGLGLAEYRRLYYGARPLNDHQELDLHKPYIDDIFLRCSDCQSSMRRVSEVADVWFDSGSMPFAQWHYPFENKELIHSHDQFPADYICEAMDQTRGWFYTLLAISILLKKGAPYKNVISLGLILDKNGVKMSKSRGNAVDPWELIQSYGVDALRWYFYTVNHPGDTKKFDEHEVQKTTRRVLMIVYNSYVFWNTYADKNAGESEARASTHILDRWVLASLHDVISRVTRHLEEYHVYEATQCIETFIDDVSRWYIRRSRSRFQDGGDSREASGTLRYVLTRLMTLMAPFTPFFSEALYRELGSRESVHLEDWPTSDDSLIHHALIRQMAHIRDLASLGLAERSKIGIKVRQPLAAFHIKDLGENLNDHRLLDILADEVNVKKVVFGCSIEDGVVGFDTHLTPELKDEGLVREIVRAVQGLRQDAHLNPGEEIILFFEVGDTIQRAIDTTHSFKKTVSAREITFRRSDVFEVEIEKEIDGEKLWIGLKRL